MAQKYLIVIDVQNDFVTGTLGTKEATEIVPHIVERIGKFDGTILFTRDTHHTDYLSTQEGKLLPVEHCIKDTVGWELVSELGQMQRDNNYIVYDKESFGSLKLAQELQKIHQDTGIESIELMGLCTDICVVSNALLLKVHMPEVPIFVDAAGCAGVTKEKHEAALEVMRSCQVIVRAEGA